MALRSWCVPSSRSADAKWMCVAAAISLACSASGGGSGPVRLGGTNPGETGGTQPGDTTSTPGDATGTNGGGVVFGDVNSPNGNDGTITVDDACVTAMAEAVLVRQPVDIILILDNSGSMADELQAVEDNINMNFANILEAADVDYRVILISRHRETMREASGESSTSICVSAPLSGIAECPPVGSAAEAPMPVFGERFFQFSDKIESLDSLRNAIAFYFATDDYGQPGWSTYLRPNAAKVFLEMSDDNADLDNNNETIEDPQVVADMFVQQITTIGPNDFGTVANPTFKFHSIVGLAEQNPPTAPYLPNQPLQTLACTGNANEVANAGETYQILSQMTGGLRFPLCQFTGYDAVFNTIANDVIVTSNIACDFAIPAPPEGEELDLTKVAVAYASGDGTQNTQFGQALTLGECQPNAFYIANDRINLCPETCTAVQADPGANVDVLFTCQSTIIIN